MTLSTISHTDPLQLEPVAQRLNVWRAARTRGQRIPDEIWQAAVDLAHIHGLNPTAAALKLNYYDLQRRLSEDRLARKPPNRAPFIELPAPGLPSRVEEPATLDLIDGSGARLTLRLPNASPKDLLPVVELFLRRRL